MIRIAVFASGNGSNFEAIVRQATQYEVAILIVDKQDAFALERADKLRIPARCFDPADYPNKNAYERAILDRLRAYDVSWIALAGYMRLCGSVLLDAYPGHILNIHPALLPAFPGKGAIHQAVAKGVKVTGVTIHLVDSGMDTGKIIAQVPYCIPEGADEDQIQSGIQTIEHELYPQTIAKLIKEESR